MSTLTRATRAFAFLFLLLLTFLPSSPAFAQRGDSQSSEAIRARGQTVTASGHDGVQRLASDPTCTADMEGRIWQNTTTDVIKACLNTTVTAVGSTAGLSGIGSCTNQFVRGLNEGAAPTCASITATDLGTTLSPTFATVTAALSGNASTATALAANPSDCGANQFANAIAANGNLTCAAITATDLGTTLDPTFDLVTGSGFVTDDTTADCSGGTCTCTMTTGSVCTVTLRNGSNAITLSGHVAAGKIGRYVVVTTGGGASKTITWAAAAGAVKWPSAVTPVATASANQDIFTFIDDGTNYLGGASLNY